MEFLNESERESFWKWVISLEVTDDPRGDFVDETRTVMRVYSEDREDWWAECESRLSLFAAALEALEVAKELLVDFRNRSEV